MPTIPIPINGPTYQSRNEKISNQESINLYPEFAKIGTERVQVALQPLYGNKLFSALNGVGRGLINHKDELYAVNGSSLYKIDRYGVSTNLGSIDGVGCVGMATDRTNLIITNGDTPYNYTTSLAKLGDVDWNNANTVKYFNDRFVFDTPTGYGLTDIQDPTTVNALNTAGGTANPDLALGVFTYRNKFYPYGRKSIESWWNTGTGNPPAARETYTHELGPIGIWAVDTNSSYSYFLGSDKILYRLSGVEKQPIGDPGISAEIQDYSDVSDCKVICARWDGEEFVFFIFPTANRSWLLHEKSDTWYRVTSGVNLDRHPINGYVECYGKKFINDYNSGNIYELDPDTFTNNGATMKWSRTSPPINSLMLGAPGKNIFLNSVHYTLKTGDCPLSGQGSDPRLIHRWSIDDGESWIEEHLDLGAKGNRQITVSSHNGMGMIEPHQNLLIQTQMTDPLRWSLIDLSIDIEASV